MMADSAFKVLVLPRGEQADISQFGAELQKICDKVSGVKVKLQADPNEITNSIKSAVSTVKFDVQFNASSIETSIKAALTGKTFDINVNPIVQNGGNNSNNNNNNNNHNNNNGGNRNPVWPKDSFSKIVNSQIYLENLKKKYNSYAVGSAERTMYGQQIQQYSQNLSARKAQFAKDNNTSFVGLNRAIKQTDQYAKAKIAAAEASAKAEANYRAEALSITDIEQGMVNARKEIQAINQDRLKSWWSQNSKYGRNLYQPEVKDAKGNAIQERSGLLVDYANAWGNVQSKLKQINEPSFQSKDVVSRTNAIKDLKKAYSDFLKVEQSVVKEASDYEKKEGNYKAGFFDELVEGISKKFGWAVMAGAAREARQALVQLYTNIVQLDGALTQISIVTGTSGNALKSFANDASNVAKAVGSTTSAIINSTETYARLGYNLQDSLNLADITAQYANVAGVDTESATSALTSIMKGFNIDPSEMEGVVDKLVKVGQEYAISAGELGDAMQRGGAALAAGGATLDEAIALMTAGNAAVQNAEIVGNALKTTSARIRSATAELTEMGEEVDDIVTSTSTYRAEIKALSGVDIMQDANTYKSVYQILTEIAQVYDSLTDINKAQLLEDLAGKRNAQVLASIITNLKDLTGSYEAAQNAAGTLATANETYLDSIQGKMNQLSTSYEQLSMKLLSNNAIKFVVDTLKLLVNVLNSIDTATGGLSTMSLEITALITLLPALFKAFAQSKALATFGDSIKVVSSGVLGLASKAIPALNGAATAASASIGAAVASMGAIALAIAAVVAVVKGIRSAIPTLSDKKAELEETKSDIAEIESKLQDVKSRLEELNAIENPTLADQAEVDKLTAENKQLEWQLELKQKLAEQEAVDVERAALKKYHNDFSDEKEIGGNPRTSGVGGFYSEMAYATTYAANAQAAWDKYYASLENDDKNAADQAKTSAEEWERLQQNKLTSAGSIYKELGQIIAENGITGATLEGQAVLDMYNEIGLALSKLEGVSIDAGTAVSSVLGEFKYEPLKTVLDQMKEAGTLSAEAIQQMFEEGEKIAETGADLENPNYLLTVLIETLAELFGLDLTSGTEGFQFLAAALNGVGEAAGNATDGLNSINYETVDAAKSKVDAITAAMKDYKEYNGLTKSSVDKLTSAFPALRDALYDSEGKLTAQGKAALGSKAAMLALTKTSLESAKAINGMNLAEARAELKRLQEELVKTQAIAAIPIKVSTVNTASGRTSVLSTGASYIDAGGNETYDPIAAKLQQKLAEKQLKDQITEQEKAISDYEQSIKDIMNSLNSNFTASSKSSSGSSTDTFKQGLEKQLKILKHQLEMEKITYEQYYAGVAKIRDQYKKKNPTKYQEEIWDLEKEIFQGRLTTFEDFVNDYNTIAENQFNNGQVLAARTTYDQILDETKKMIDWGVSYGLSENGDFMQKVRKQWKDTCQAIMDMINQVYDEYESYLDTFDLWGSGKSGITQSAYYEQWLKELKEAYQKGLMKYEDYVTKHNEIAGKLYDTRKSSIDEIINMTIDMLKQESEDMIDALDDQIDKYNELIDLKKKLLEQSNDELDHEQEVADLVSEIAELQSKIAQLSLDDSREAAAKRQELEQQLAEKQKELDKTQRDWALDQTNDALDKEKDSFEKEKEDEKKILEDSVDDWMSLYRKAIKMLSSDWEGMYSKLQAYNDKYCDSIDGIESLKTAWENVDAVVKQYGYDVEAARNSGGDLGIAPTNPIGSNLVNNGINEEGVKSIVAQMRSNMNAWHVAYANGDKAEQKRLSDENLRLGSSLGQYGLKVVRDEPTGVWYIDHIGGTRLFDKYHTGGVVGNQPTNNDREVLALLEKGELVLDDKKKQSLFAMFDRLSAAASNAAAAKMSYRIGDTSDKAGDVFSPSVSVTINHDGNMDDDDARRYGQITADAVLEKLRTAFNRRGM